MSKTRKPTSIGIVGCGAIGSEVALFIDKELKGSARIYGLADKDMKSAERLKKKIKSPAGIFDLDDLVAKVDLVIETASAEAAKVLLKKALKYRKDIIILSIGALIDMASFLEKAKKRKIKIYVPSGAICGVDGLGALSMGTIKRLCLVTSKPPKGLIGADYLKKKNINLKNITKEKIVFKGRVQDAVKYFPKNINVAATLLLASSFNDVEVCIKADPKLKRNVHCISVEAKEAKLNISVENVPSKFNPKTSALAILSTQYLLKNIFSSLKIGS